MWRCVRAYVHVCVCVCVIWDHADLEGDSADSNALLELILRGSVGRGEISLYPVGRLLCGDVWDVYEYLKVRTQIK